eukprot:SAG22_NODE_1044_length_5882_cov_3.015390_3_plen_167_part_00
MCFSAFPCGSTALTEDRRPLQIPLDDAPSSPKDGGQPSVHPPPRKTIKAKRTLNNPSHGAAKQQQQQQQPGGGGALAQQPPQQPLAQGDAAKGKENAKPPKPGNKTNELVLEQMAATAARPQEFGAGEEVLAESDGAWYEATVTAVKPVAARVPGEPFYHVHYHAW